MWRALLSADGHCVPHEPAAAEAYAHRVLARRRAADGVQVERGVVTRDRAAAVRVHHAVARQTRPRLAARREAHGAGHAHSALLLLARLAGDPGVAPGRPAGAGVALRPLRAGVSLRALRPLVSLGPQLSVRAVRAVRPVRPGRP